MPLTQPSLNNHLINTLFQSRPHPLHAPTKTGASLLLKRTRKISKDFTSLPQTLRFLAEHVIFYQMVVFQLSWLVTGAKNICAHIDAWLRLWNQSLFDELITGYYAEAKSYLTRGHGYQNTEQRHCTFSNIVLLGKLRKAIWFVCKQDMCRVLLPNERTSYISEPANEIIVTFLAEKNPRKKIQRLFLKRTPKRIRLYGSNSWRMWLNWSHKNFWGVWDQ